MAKPQISHAQALRHVRVVPGASVSLGIADAGLQIDAVAPVEAGVGMALLVVLVPLILTLHRHVVVEQPVALSACWCLCGSALGTRKAGVRRWTR